MTRRRFMLQPERPPTVEVSCERLYMKYADARSEGRVDDFLTALARDLERAEEIRLTAREWLSRDEFRTAVGPLLRGRGLLCAIVLAAAFAATACGGSASGKAAGDERDAPQVNVVQVNPLELRREVEAVGTLAARDETVVSAEVEARVARVAADLGDRVAANAELVVLDAEKLRYRVDEQRAALEQTRARLGATGNALPAPEETPDVISAVAARTEAEQRLIRARQLAEKNLVPAQELERAQTEVERARATHQTALASARNLLAEVRAREAALNSAKRDLQDTVIRAPFDGVVAERLVSPGQFVRVQTPVMRLVRLHPLRLTTEIPERFGPAIRVGHVLHLRVDAYPDRTVEGRVTRISPAVDLKSRAFSIEGEVPNTDGALKAGTFARVRIVTDRVDRILAVPVTAVQTRYGRSIVFVVREGKATSSEVKLGDRLDARVEVLDGIEPGTLVVADGVEALTDGMIVTPKTVPAAGASR